MNEYDANTCVNAFGKFCEDAERNELTSSEEHQYWVFERGYQAAMLEIAKVMQLRQNVRSIDLGTPVTYNSAAYQ